VSDLTTAIHRTAKEIDASGGLLDLAEKAVQLSDWLWEEIQTREVPDLKNIACAEGCNWCCYQLVGITPVQAFHIAAYVEDGKASIDKGGLRQRLLSVDKRTNGMTNTERLAARIPCAFLDDGMCSIYPVRPFGCRGANSVDADICRETVEQPEQTRGRWNDDGGPAWIHAVPFDAMRALQEGLNAGLAEHGLQPEKLELTAAICAVLDHENAMSRWQDGEDIFATAQLRTG